VWSDAGGAVASRPVRVRYRFPRWDSPGRIGRDGVVLLVFTIIASPIALGLGFWALSSRPSLNNYLGAALAFGNFIWWWYISLAHLRRGHLGAGRRTVYGVTIARTTETFHGVESGDPFDLYYLGIDNGTSDWYIGWEVPKAVYQDLPDGTPVEAVVSGDGRYLYSIRTLHR
jgi:hypothetical protein